MTVECESFGATADGTAVQIYTLEGRSGLRVRITDYGGTVVNVWAPDRVGELADVVLGFDTLDEYIARNMFLGCLVGRFANRIARGRFELNGRTYRLAQNSGPNHSHGGPVGFDKRVWAAEPGDTHGQPALILRHTSPDGDQGYPGALSVQVTYRVTDDNAIQIDYRAETDARTILNLTNHSSFNLAGGGTILDHLMTIHADCFTPVDDRMIPTGAIEPVDGTPLDFREPRLIGAAIDTDHEQLRRAHGYDHNWVLGPPDGTLRHAATAEHPPSGRRMLVYTTQPGMQFFTSNRLVEPLPGKSGQTYRARSGFCLETQHFPDSPNQDNFPSVVLEVGQTYSHRTIFRFDAGATRPRP